ncbi:hypothetical protein [Roseovarius conchicola]|uniref:hypothetical protein n=1 Tax=Roseovarius conchicola TaxID=3121636 RepID=UPI003B968D39
MIADIRDAVGISMANTLRVSLDESFDDLGFSNAEPREFIEMNSDLPDLWDLAHGTWETAPAPAASRTKWRRKPL